ncbi:lipopolysaccharide assembly protein LapA domain-containing protein [Alterinioella nitratireducens]|uniref:lipopolysaccharide assembly protein LapA domain-containing protein n=1 Tax=Alterinioella nitratireducens TaxID=2735915 RepID=UPI001552C6B4|nr:lipopolysaccharide assembly protein LapA domain-containing protein [Alterinioella nitratireducens]NPD20426.1 LapA family protein [Alterinioella nitratireducens]
MRFIKYLFLAVVALVLVLLALANREPVTLTVLPDNLAEWVNWNFIVTLPLFLVILGGIVAGLLIGFVWEWFREHRQRAEAKAQRKERDRLAREVAQLRGQKRESQDDVLALVE